VTPISLLEFEEEEEEEEEDPGPWEIWRFSLILSYCDKVFWLLIKMAVVCD